MNQLHHWLIHVSSVFEGSRLQVKRGIGVQPSTAPHPHPEGLHSGGHLLPDSAQSYDAQYLSIQLCAHELQNH